MNKTKPEKPTPPPSQIIKEGQDPNGTHLKNFSKEYRIKEEIYDNGSSLFFAQHLEDVGWIIKKFKWVNIQNISGYDKKETAEKDIKGYIDFYNPPKVIETIIYKV